MLVIAVSVVMYILGITLTYRATRNLFSPPMFVLYTWFFVLIGGINYYMTEGHYLTPLVAGLSSMSLSLGLRFFSLSANFCPKRDTHNITPQQLSSGVTNITALRLAFIISLGLTLIPAFIILRNSPLLNSEVTKTELVRPGQGPLVRLYRDGLPILTVMWILIAMKTNKFRSWFDAGLIIGITGLVLLLTGYKGFVLWFAVLLAIVFGYLKPHVRQWKLMVITLLFIGLTAALGVIYLTPSPGYHSFKRSLSYLWKRMTVEQTLGLDYVLYTLVPSYGFYHGETMMWDFTWTVSDLTQGIIFPNPHPSLTNHIANLMIGHRSIYAVTTMIMGDLYANWGLLGVIIGCFLYGGILEALYLRTVKMKKSIVFFPFWAYLNWIFVQMASTGSPIAFFLSQFSSLVLIYILIIAFYTYFCLPFMNRSLILKRGVGDTHAKT